MTSDQLALTMTISELYRRAAATPRAELVADLERLADLSAAGLRTVWAEMGMAGRMPARAVATARIRRRVLDRHDAAVRVTL